jgi:type I restriction enzyme S subunit
LKQAALRQLFTRGLPSFAKASAGRRGERETRFGTVPESWGEAPLSSCAFVQTGIAKNAKNYQPDDVEIPYLRVANVQDGHLDLTEMKTIRASAADVEATLLREGDVVLTEGGDFDKLGRGFLWEGQLPQCVHQNHVFAVRTKRDRLDPRFFAYLAQSPYGKAYFLSVAHKTTNLACINTTKLRAFPVLLPDPAEQREIAAHLAVIDAKLTHHEARQKLLRELFRTLLRDLMTARRRVSVALD